MSCEIVQPFTDPVLSNKTVSLLQADFAGKDYLEKVYPIAYVGEINAAFKEQQRRLGFNQRHLYPRVYLNDGESDYIDVMPDNKLKGYTFWEIEDTSDYDRGEKEYTVKLNQIFWVNLRLIDDKGYDYTDLIKADALKTLDQGQFSNDITMIDIAENYENIYNRYNLPQEKLQQFMYPFSGFKLTYSIRENLDTSCLPDFTITSAPSECI